MQYVPFGPELEGVPNIIVDGRGNDATLLVLSHWPGNATPPDLKADSSAEIVIKYLRSRDAEALRRGAEAVSNNHFDVDGLIGMWALLNPDAALERAELLVAIAECGDFERWTGEEATKIACALRGLEELVSSPVHQGLAGIDDANEANERTAYAYREMLPLVTRLLEDVDSFEEYWRDEFARVLKGRELFAKGAVAIKEMPELDMAVFALPETVHPIALNEQTECSRVVLMIDEDRYLVRYRYESWVDYQSREVPPRIDLRPFADLLQTFEGNPGYWEADDVASIVPVMRFRDDADASASGGDMAPSSITSGLFVNLLAQFLGENAQNESLLWSPATAQMGT